MKVKRVTAGVVIAALFLTLAPASARANTEETIAAPRAATASVDMRAAVDRAARKAAADKTFVPAPSTARSAAEMQNMGGGGGGGKTMLVVTLLSTAAGLAGTYFLV